MKLWHNAPDRMEMFMNMITSGHRCLWRDYFFYIQTVVSAVYAFIFRKSVRIRGILKTSQKKAFTNDFQIITKIYKIDIQYTLLLMTICLSLHGKQADFIIIANFFIYLSKVYTFESFETFLY